MGTLKEDYLVKLPGMIFDSREGTFKIWPIYSGHTRAIDIGDYIEATYHGYLGVLNTFKGAKGEDVAVHAYELWVHISAMRMPAHVIFTSTSMAIKVLDSHQIGDRLIMKPHQMQWRSHVFHRMLVNDEYSDQNGRIRKCQPPTNKK